MVDASSKVAQNFALNCAVLICTLPYLTGSQNGNYFFSTSFVKQTYIDILVIICVVLNPPKLILLLLGANWSKSPQGATSALFDGSRVNLPIEAFSECSRGESKSNHTFQNVSDLCEHLLQYGEDGRRCETNQEIEELMLKLRKESFELLDKSE